MSSTTRTLSAVAIVGAAALALVGCAGSSGADTGDGGDSGSDKAVTLGVVSGWNDMTDIANLYKYVLEKNGYTVDIKELSEIATMYVAASEGDVDTFSTSPSTIHKQYWDKYQDDLEIVGSYYEDASIFLAVPDYASDLQSIEDLPDHAEELNSTIVSIEPGAGVVSTAKDVVFPAYGLDGIFTLQTSSTAAMLASLQEAVDNQKPIVVTGWSPWWANSTFDLRKLEDPKKAYGDPYTLDMVATAGFSDAHPDVANMIQNLVLTEDQFNTLDNAVYQEFEAGQEQEAVASWLEQNPDILEQMEAALNG
ncbi:MULTISPECIES: glycine betaine ABC transporter substrate-binding protein [Microbacterium]|uniref:glycine betaine ABC transporter substrate-binding protein n=1 Tax=Microbacterium TaxID=33882 RepID=UPI000D652044|nr:MULTISPECIES: glycine betaine ABC transporter substrate-binding protein [Microbacterium]